MNTLHVRQGDTVIVLSGKDKGKKGKVLATMPKDDKVVVEGVNVATRHQKPRKQTDPGGIIKKEVPLHACKVGRVCASCGKPMRKSVEILSDGTRERRDSHVNCKD